MRATITIAACLAAGCGKGSTRTRTPEPASEPTAQVVMFSPVSSCGQGYDDEGGDGGDSDAEGMSVRALLEPAPGYARLPALEFEVSSGGTSLGKASGSISEWDPAEICATLPVADGPMQISLKVDGVVYATLEATLDNLQPDSFPHESTSVTHAAVDECDGLECPSFPALSPDGTIVVVREAAELVSPGEICNPPVDDLTVYYEDVGEGLAAVASKNLAGYETLGCSNEPTLLDGFTVSIDDESLTISDSAGAVAAEAGVYGDSPEACPSTTHRVVLVRQYGGPGGDCADIGGYSYEVLRY